MQSLSSVVSEFLQRIYVGVVVVGGGGKPDCHKRSNTKQQPSTQCKVRGTINILKYVNDFKSTNPTTLILSSLVSEF